MNTRLFVATKALIQNPEGRVLIVRESGKYEDGTNVGKYDVPGGRIEQGEYVFDGLKREVLEETGLSVSVDGPVSVGEWRPEVRGEQWQIVGIFFACSTEVSDVALSADHDEYLWIDPKTYKDYPIMENLAPVFEAYLAR